MGRTPFDLADIVRRHRGELERAQPLTPVQGRALSAITLCRTAALGGHVNSCAECGLEEDPSYNSCRNRNCPKCQALAKRFRKKMLNALRRLRSKGVLRMTDGAFGTLIASLAGQDWNLDIRKAFKTPAFVLTYLGRYTHRVGIANSRLLEVTPDKVTFRTKDGRQVSLHPVAFLQRFVQHVLPDRFKEIRHTGLYALPKALAKAKLGPIPAPAPPRPTWEEALLTLTERDVAHCVVCGGVMYRRVIPMPGTLQRHPRRPP